MGTASIGRVVGNQSHAGGVIVRVVSCDYRSYAALLKVLVEDNRRV
jgi:hypothetical protein